MKTHALFLTSAISLILSAIASAQSTPVETATVPSTTPTVAPLVTPTPAAPWAKELDGLELDLAQSGYALNQSIAGKIKLISVAERIINSFCIEGISPKYSISKGLTASCNLLTSELLTLDPSNPSATCATKRFYSRECFDAYSAIDVAVIDSTRDGLEKDLDAILTTKQDTSDIIEIENNLIFLGRAIESDHSPETYENFEKAYSKQLQRFCTVSRLRLPTTHPTAIATALPTGQQSGKPFDKMLQELSHQLDSKNDIKLNDVTRYRLVSAPCHRILSLLREYSPSSYLSLCYRNGPFSPQCAQARKKASKPGQPLIPDGIGRF